MIETDMDSGVYPKRPVEIARARGATIWDSEGKEYLDMGASYGVCNVGHCNLEVVEALRAQAGELIYISSTYPTPRRRELLEKIINISPPGMARVFLANSGTEANEAALRFSMHVTGRERIVSTMRAFHGRTMASLSTTWNKKHSQGNARPGLPVDFVPYGNEEGLKETITGDTAALILEPVQGEGGVHLPPVGFLRAARDICTDRGTLLIMDEIQTGMARTGKIFAVEHSNIVPDIMTVGKSLGGGYPIAAAVLHENMGEMERGLHGSTFGGNPLGCAAGCAAIDQMIELDLAGRARTLGEHFTWRLSSVDIPAFRDVRGLGLMVAVELKGKNTPYLNGMLDRGIAPLPSGNTVIRFLPPLVVEKAQIDRTVDALTEIADGDGDRVPQRAPQAQ